jgi:SAGA-associated factor 73
VKKETKAEKKEKREREKMEKKRLAGEAAAADPTTGKKSGVTGMSGKKGGKKAAAAAAVRLAEGLGEDVPENLDDLDSEAEVDDLVQVIRAARERGVVAVPLADPCDAGSWFVQSRERARNCRDLLVGALGSGGGTGVPGGIGTMGMAGRPGNMGLGVGIGIGGARLG